MIIFFFFIFDEEANTTVPVEADVENNEELEFFFDDKVRKVWHKQEEEWYFSVVDVCQVLTDSADGRKYWNKLKQRLKEEGNETVTNCHQLKMRASDGKMRKTDAANAEQLLRIIQSIPSKHAESFRSWLGKCRTMTDNEENSYTETLFEAIKHVNAYGNEFWYARELQKALEYSKWDNFKRVIDKAIAACKNSENAVSDHFADVGKMVNVGSGAERKIEDFELSRYACYLIVQNGDSRKKVIALGQTYFAVKTRQQELIENFDDLSEEKKRLAIRSEMKAHNKSLAEAAKMAGISEPRDYAIFQNKGYQGLYGGLGRKEIHARKGLKKSQDILDYMGSTELAANLFRATQTDEKLRKEKILGKEAANQTHYEIGKKVRQTIKEIGGTMPEDLPTPAKGIKQIEREQTKKIED